MSPRDSSFSPIFNIFIFKAIVNFIFNKYGKSGDSELHNMSEAAWIPPKEQQRKRNEDRVAGLKDASLLGNTN